MDTSKQRSAGISAKKYHLMARSVMESILRRYDLGSTQWYVLWHLIHDGPLPQRDLIKLLQVEKATLSGVISALVRKGLVEQVTGKQDQRQKCLLLTPAGNTLWETLPDPIDLILKTAFEDVSEEDLDTVARVLSRGTERLNNLLEQGKKA